MVTTKSRKLDIDPEVKPTLTVEEVAKVLGTKRSATYEAVRRGQLGKVIRVGRTILVPTAALRRLLELDERDPDEETVSA